ncbi:hypothetical protein Tco_0844823, partial [Tanacetum coccineum]
DTYPILLSFTPCGNKSILRVLRIILVILPEHPSETKVFHNEDGNPARANIKQALGSYERPHKGVKASANSDIVYFFTSAQDGDPLQDDVRLCLGDDLKKAQDHNQRQVKDESKDHYPKYDQNGIDHFAQFHFSQLNEDEGWNRIEESRTTTRNPTYLTPSNVNDTGMTNEEEGPEGDETTIIPNKETSQSPILYHPSKSSSVHFPSWLKKHKKDDEDE